MNRRKIAAVVMAGTMILALSGCGTAAETGSSEASEVSEVQTAANIGADENATSYDSSTAGEHAILADGEDAEYNDIKVTKTGDEDSGDDSDFYGTNAAVFATNGANLTISNATIETNASHANAVFSYGEGTELNISDSIINTTSNNSGGIMVTGGGTLNASNLQITTEGGSSAAIRSDRGGGTMNIDGGTYTANGSGSPAIYSTAEVNVSNATLTGGTAQAVVVEGGNSVNLKDCKVTGNNTSKNSDKSDYYQAVMLYQSMSGDASDGGSTFTMDGGSLTSTNGGMFFVTNTVSTIDLTDVELDNSTDDLLRICAAGWGNDGSNGGHVTFNASKQELNGVITVDDISELNLNLDDGSTFEGSIDNEGTVYVELSGDSKWVLTGDTSIDYLKCDEDSIDLNGYTLTVGGKEYTEGTAYDDDAITFTVSESSSGGSGNGAPPDGQGGGQSHGQGDGSTPPEKPGQNN